MFENVLPQVKRCTSSSPFDPIASSNCLNPGGEFFLGSVPESTVNQAGLTYVPSSILRRVSFMRIILPFIEI